MNSIQLKDLAKLCCLSYQVVRVEGRSIPYKGIISELTLCFYYNHACVVHVNKAHNGQ